MIFSLSHFGVYNIFQGYSTYFFFVSFQKGHGFFCVFFESMFNCLVYVCFCFIFYFLFFSSLEGLIHGLDIGYRIIEFSWHQ